MRTLQFFMLIILSGCIYAQDAEFTAVASPDVLRVGEQFNLIFTSNQEFESLELPDLKDFDLLGGPSQGHSQSVSSVSGKITTTSTYQYTYFLRAVKEGKFTIQPAAIKIKSKSIKSNPVTVEVIKATAPAANQNARPSSGSKGSGQVSENDLFVRLVLDKQEAYLGEQIMATVKIYTKTNLAGIDQGFKGPDFTGFFTEPVETPPLRNLQREVVNGDIYYTGVIRRAVIIPQKAGVLTIQSFDLDVALRREVRRRIADPFFDDFSIPEVQEIPVKLTSRPVKITVENLPPNAPASFQGAVGSFRISSSLNKTSTATHEPLTLRIAISGKGNLKLVNEVPVSVPYDMEKYDPVINTNFNNPLSGSKTFEYMIVPRVPGSFTIPPVEFTFFNAEEGRYKTLKTEAHQVFVEKGVGDTLMAVGPGINKEDVKLLSQDIRFIKTRSSRLNRMDHFYANSVWYYLTWVALLALFFALLYFRRKIIRENADVAGIRLRRADKFARKRLKKSESLLKQGDDAAFFEEVLGALWGYLSDKLAIPVSQLSKDSAITALEARNVGNELIDELFDIINKSEMARYGNNALNIAKEALYNKSVNVITALQQKLK